MEQRAPERAERLTVAEYLDAEAVAAERHEYFDGRVVAMAGGTAEHSLITGNLIREAGNAIRRGQRKGCRVYDSNLKVRVSSVNRFYYPDAFIVCGDLEHPPDDRRRTSITNPQVIFEVLSDSTEERDRSNKFDHYVRLPSLREYVLVGQHQPVVQVFLRQDDGTWRLTFHRGLEAQAHLASLNIDLALAEVYADVTFEDEAR